MANFVSNSHLKLFSEKFTNFVFSSINTRSNVKIHSLLFDLHSTVTPVILLSGVLFLSFNQYFGEPITCLNHKNDIPKELIEKYCWIAGSFVAYKQDNDIDLKENVTVEEAYPGVRTLQKEDYKFYTKYYQWVHFILIIQSILFIVPKKIWGQKEGFKIEQICNDLTKKRLSEIEKNELKKIYQDVTDLLLTGSNSLQTFLACEFLYLINLIIQIWFTQLFLNQTFLRLGYDWLKQNPTDNDPLIKIFPRLTKCSFNVYGYSGSIETKDSLCFLPLNIINEKIYLSLWFWMLFLLIFTVLNLISRFSLLFYKNFRYKSLKRKAPLLKKSIIQFLIKNLGHWFITDILSQNLKVSEFTQLIEKIYLENFHKNIFLKSI